LDARAVAETKRGHNKPSNPFITMFGKLKLHTFISYLRKISVLSDSYLLYNILIYKVIR